MKRLILVTTVAVSLLASRPALGWDPFGDGSDSGWPVSSWTPEPAPVAPPLGIYLVTETYASDSVTRAGAMTTYSTETVHEITGSYARVLESVATGGSSSYDGAAFNGRAALTDGRAVAGTYYENYVRTDGGFIPISVVFFQDDSEIARASRGALQLPVAPPAAAPVTLVIPQVIPLPSPGGSVTPVIDRPDPVPAAPVRAATPASTLLADRSIEVLRGRRVTLSFGGQDVRAWRYLSGEALSMGALAGTALEPFVARWDRLAPNAAWIVRFVVDYADGTSHELVVRVAVRSPGLVE